MNTYICVGSEVPIARCSKAINIRLEFGTDVQCRSNYDVKPNKYLTLKILVTF